MNKNSLNAYFDESNQRRFNSHRGMIIRELKRKPGQHSYMLSLHLRLTNEAVKKRLSDLYYDGLIEVSGTYNFGGNDISCYKINEQLNLFSSERKPTLKKWMQKNYPSVLAEWLCI